MAATQVMVSPSESGWKLDTGETFETQQQAIDAARSRLEEGGGGELVVQAEDGQIRQKDTIGRPDPRTSKG